MMKTSPQGGPYDEKGEAMKEDRLARQVESARSRLDALHQRAGTSVSQQRLLDEALQELSVALEELQVSAEEMRSYNDELAASREEVEAERRKYRELFDFAPAGYLVTDPSGNIRKANRAAAAMLDCRRESLVRKPMISFLAEKDHKEFFELLNRLVREDVPGEWRIQLKLWDKTEVFPAALSVSRIFDSQGRLVGLRWLVRDISERIQTEKVLQESEERFRLLVEGVKDYAIFMLDPNGVVISWNAAAERIKGYRAEEITGKHFSCFYPPADIERGKPEHALKVATAEGRFEDEGWRIRKNGSLFWASSIITALRDDSGTLRGFAKITRDITERKQAEEALRQSQTMLKTFMDNCPVTIFLKDTEGRYLYINPEFERVNRKQSGQVIGKTDFEIFPQKQAAVFRANDLKVLEAGVPLEFEVTLREGEPHTSLVCKFPLLDADGKVYGICGIATDITARKRAEEQIQSNLRRIAALRDINIAISSTLNLPTLLDLLLEKLEHFFPYPTASTVRVFERETGKFQYLACRNVDETEWKARAERLPGPRSKEVIQSKAPLVVRNIQADPRSLRREFQIRSGLVSYLGVPLVAKGAVLGVLCLFSKEEHEFSAEEIDFVSSVAASTAMAIYNSQLYEQLKKQAADLEITRGALEFRVRARTSELADANEALRAEIAERQRIEERLRESEQQLRILAKELEEQLIVSDRLVSLGQLTASIVHEFNNPLQIILGFTQDLISETQPYQSDYEALKMIEGATFRCKEIIRGLADFARPTPADLRRSIVEPIVHNSVKLALSYLEKSNVRVEIDIQPDLPEIHADSQQLQQVLINLFFNAAEAMPKGGKLTIRAKTDPVLSPGVDKDGAESHSEVTIAVSDTGTGVDPESMPNIFRPFFTTKKKKGMGLGLSICEGILKAHGGRISVESTWGIGTTFCLHFPLTEAKSDDRVA
jgi:PAS domain S-box-containing protein